MACVTFLKVEGACHCPDIAFSRCKAGAIVNPPSAVQEGEVTLVFRESSAFVCSAVAHSAGWDVAARSARERPFARRAHLTSIASPTGEVGQ